MRGLPLVVAGSLAGVVVAWLRASRRGARGCRHAAAYHIAPLSALTAPQLQMAAALLQTQWPAKECPSYLTDAAAAQAFARAGACLLALDPGGRVVGHVRVIKTGAGVGVVRATTAALLGAIWMSECMR